MKIRERIHMTSYNRWCLLMTPSWSLPQERKRHDRCNLCGAVNAGEMPSSELTDLYGLPGTREGI